MARAPLTGFLDGLRSQDAEGCLSVVSLSEALSYLLSLRVYRIKLCLIGDVEFPVGLL